VRTSSANCFWAGIPGVFRIVMMVCSFGDCEDLPTLSSFPRKRESIFALPSTEQDQDGFPLARE
jgi:hypothetical protein